MSAGACAMTTRPGSGSTSAPDQAGAAAGTSVAPAQEPAVPAADLEREAAAAEELAAQLRARADALREGRPAVS